MRSKVRKAGFKRRDIIIWMLDAGSGLNLWTHKLCGRNKVASAGASASPSAVTTDSCCLSSNWDLFIFEPKDTRLGGLDNLQHSSRVSGRTCRVRGKVPPHRARGDITGCISWKHN